MGETEINHLGFVNSVEPQQRYSIDLLLSFFVFCTQTNDFCLYQILLRINGGKSKCPDELRIIKSDNLKLSEVIKQADKKFNK